MMKKSTGAAERLQAQIEALKAKMNAVQVEERRQERKRREHAAIVVGKLLLSRPDTFGLDAERLRSLLDACVTRPHDRRALDLPELPSASANHSQRE